MSRWASTALLLGTLAWSGVSHAALTSCDGFPDNDEIGATLMGWADLYPATVRYFSIGQSTGGAEIHAVAISLGAGAQRERAEPEIRVIGGIHGNECLSVMQVMEIAETLAECNGTHEATFALIENAHFVLVPLVNPDGHDGPGATRTNANGVDLNRNFGFAWSADNTVNGDAPFSEIETRHLRNLSQDHAFVMGLSFHTAAAYVNAAWNYVPFHPRDDVLFRAMGESYAQDNEAYEAVFGWDWYQISGDVNDWSLGTLGTFDWTIEISSDTELDWAFHGQGSLAFFQWALRGASGIVTDAQTGEPLPAMITVEPEGEPVFTDPDLGDYHRILVPGTYELTAWASGYRAKTVEGVVVAESGKVQVDFALAPDPTQRAGFQVNRMVMERDLTNAYYDTFGYDNTTIPSDALGTSDGWYYSIGYAGDITIDMGAQTPVEDGDGPDLLVASGTGSDDPAHILLAQEQDGPFVDIGEFAGDVEIDLTDANLPWVRFVRVVDAGQSSFGDADGGYDLDAVENISTIGGPSDPDTDNDSDTEPDAPRVTAISGGCTTATPGSTDHSLLTLLQLTLNL